MTAEQEKTSESQAEESGHSEFKLFRQIEQTIEGGYEFVVRFVKTSRALCVQPSTVIATLGQPGDTVFSRPFTYLSVSAFVSSVILRSLIVANLSLLFYESEPSPSLTEEIRGVTVTGMLQTSLPTIVSVLLFGSLFATSRRRRLGKTDGLQLVCYHGTLS